MGVVFILLAMLVLSFSTQCQNLGGDHFEQQERLPHSSSGQKVQGQSIVNLII